VERYAGKRAVVIGGTRGMGLATAQLLSDHGASVLVTGRTAADVETAQRQLGDRVDVIASDATSLADIAALGEHVEERLGRVDAMFVSAGISRAASVEDTSEELYDEVFDVNVKGPYFTIQRLAPLMSEGSGIVLATSVSNVKGLPMNSVYAASKAALRSMARTFARELLPRGVRVNAVSPGPIDTGVLDRSLPKDAADAAKRQMRDNNPMGRFGTPDEIAAAVLFLAFEATFTTGSELAVDGGVSQLL
jgi:NAD(P)-dependent dehydrogenase (short-subunit alcohol dehydrogenase family)